MFLERAEEVFEEDNVLDWILEMHHGNTMKNVSRQSLLSMVDNYDYLAVVFCEYTYLTIDFLKTSSFNSVKCLYYD